MRLLEITFERYKPFKERQILRLATMNILIGKNGSGKSALCRLLLLLAQAVSDDPNGTLDLFAGNVEHGTSFDDLVYERSALPFLIGLKIGDSKSQLSLEISIRYVREKRELVIESLHLDENCSRSFSLALKDLGDLVAADRTYVLNGLGHANRDCSVRFSGILPIEIISGEVINLQRVTDQFRKALPMPSYLGPYRIEPKDILHTPRTIIKDLGSRGERALELLAHDKIRHLGMLTKDVNEWIEGNFQGQGFELDVSANLPRAAMIDQSAGIRVPLSNTGAGFSQALPIVVQNFAVRRRLLPSNILIVEQPELHLHPAAHGAIADLFMDTTRPGLDLSAPICFVETHSEQFIMRVRRRIAEGRNHQDFSLISFGHIEDQEDFTTLPLKTIDFDENGDPSSWPLGVFEESFDDLTKLRQAASGIKS